MLKYLKYELLPVYCDIIDSKDIAGISGKAYAARDNRVKHHSISNVKQRASVAVTRSLPLMHEVRDSIFFLKIFILSFLPNNNRYFSFTMELKVFGFP